MTMELARCSHDEIHFERRKRVKQLQKDVKYGSEGSPFLRSSPLKSEFSRAKQTLATYLAAAANAASIQKKSCWKRKDAVKSQTMIFKALHLNGQKSKKRSI